MEQTNISLNQWKELYESAVKIKELAPWDFMNENDIFGVKDPDSDQIGFISVMGALGEHLAMAIYLGAKGLYKFWDFQSDDEASLESLFQLNHLQLSFEDRADLAKNDLNIIKKLGFKFRGKHDWPMFRSYRPGFLPWYLDPQEAQFFSHVLKQAETVMKRFKEDPTILDTDSDISYLIRVPIKKGNNLVWEDKVEEIEPSEPETVSIFVDMELFDKLKQLPKVPMTTEIDLFMMPVRIEEKGRRPFFPYLLLSVNRGDGIIIGNDMIQPEATLEEMWGTIPNRIVLQFAKLEIVPQRIALQSQLLFQLLKPITDELGIQLNLEPNLDQLNESKQFLMNQFS